MVNLTPAEAIAILGVLIAGLVGYLRWSRKNKDEESARCVEENDKADIMRAATGSESEFEHCANKLAGKCFNCEVKYSDQVVFNDQKRELVTQRLNFLQSKLQEVRKDLEEAKTKYSLAMFQLVLCLDEFAETIIEEPFRRIERINEIDSHMMNLFFKAGQDNDYYSFSEKVIRILLDWALENATIDWESVRRAWRYRRYILYFDGEPMAIFCDDTDDDGNEVKTTFAEMKEFVQSYCEDHHYDKFLTEAMNTFMEAEKCLDRYRLEIQRLGKYEKEARETKVFITKRGDINTGLSKEILDILDV